MKISKIPKLNSRVTIVTGENGIGKTTLVNQLKCIWEKNSVTFLDQKELRPLMDINLQTYINVLGKSLHGFDEDKFFEILNLFSFKSSFEILLNHFSGGENQIVKLATTLCFKSDLYVLDEPFNHLDKNNKEKLLEYIRDSKEKFLIVSHMSDQITKFNFHRWEVTREDNNIEIKELSNG